MKPAMLEYINKPGPRMNKRDRLLGMNASITRRDFVGGMGIAAGAALLPVSGCVEDRAGAGGGVATYYPPELTGMRGSHPGSFEVAHAAVQGQRWDAEATGEHYDLVVVGAGISGLSAAYFYRRDVNPDARILILDNHDDFGGHAKRNEFEIDGRLYIGFGGTMFIEAPATYPKVAAELLQELGIDASQRDDLLDESIYESRGLKTGTFFDKETFGADHLSFDAANDYEAPLSARARQELARLLADEVDYLDGMAAVERVAILRSHSWEAYLAKYANIGDEVLRLLRKRPHGVWAIGADAFPALMAMEEGYPGFAGMDLGTDDGEVPETPAGPRNFHFPDGNATIARMLVRQLVPSAAAGDSMHDVVTERFDYSQLDRDGAPIRVRLNSTVVDLRHVGEMNGTVRVSYVADEDPLSVTADKAIWAGYHALAPFTCPELNSEQADALKTSVRAPLVYTNVLIRNWHSFVELGLRRAYCPGSFFQSIRLDFPVSIGDYQFPTTPDEPVVLHLQHIPTDPGKAAAEQFRAGRQALLQTSFESFERHVREQLYRILGAGGFDPASDIAAITVNRWPHGYAYSVDGESGDVAWNPEMWRHARKPWEVARQRVGNIHFAGTDAASNAMTEAAIEQAYRAVQEI